MINYRDKVFFILLFVLFLSCINGFAQGSARWIVNETINKYAIAGQRFAVYTHEVVNNGDNDIWLWFSRYDLSEVCGMSAARDYFLSRREDLSDIMSLLTLSLESNVGRVRHELFSSFVKSIKPSESFSIHFISNNWDTNTREKVQSFMSNQVKIHCLQELIEYDVGFSLFRRSSFIFYRSNSIVIPVESIVKYIHSEN